MNTHESYVSLETAKMLKEAGFDWNTLTYYPIDDEVLNERALVGSKVTFNHNRDGSAYSAPTLAVAQRWLREEKEMYTEAYLTESHHTAVWVAQVYQWVERPLGRELRDKCLCTGIGPVYFDTYEQALEEGIKKCLTILLQK